MPEQNQPVHPLKTRARVLLTSVFGPYAQDDEYGSRRINPMELYQNQVTRVQGGFSLRMFHRSFGLMMIHTNIEAPCTLLDFPLLEQFTEEIRERTYDVIGISGIVPNIGKVRKMCELIRRHQPAATIVIGGHIANKEGLAEMIDADHIVRGEGVRWFQRYLGQDDQAPFRHPLAISGFDGRMMGIPLSKRQGGTAAILIPSVGCPIGCNFCSTSALFGGKGKFVNFYETGDELFEVMCDIERKLKVRSFFVMDENFLLQKKRALRLLELMEDNRKSWTLNVFSSARVLQSYTMDQLVRLGIAWAWMGLEGEECAYDKLRGTDTKAFVNLLQAHGISVLGSSIIGLEEHRPENMEAVIDYAVSHETVFHQFMLYTPIPGTPLYEQHKKAGTLLPEEELPCADAHGQYRFNYRHQHIREGKEEGYLLEAFRRDFVVNGPSLLRLIRVLLNGWRMYGDDPRRPVRERMAWQVFPLRSVYAGAVWAMRKWYRCDERIKEKADVLLKDIYATFGWRTRLIAPLVGRFAHFTLKREEARLTAGWQYEPRTWRDHLEGRGLVVDSTVNNDSIIPCRDTRDWMHRDSCSTS
ncbi:MAG: cobalamin-dependent protein [Proteobacteria bacterium]|nr:cobalamin-dependent protein [Pseudomonadota bacterium]MBU2262786.1 cobalamin-dependent protein [Pseudomonadota bacterium]